MAQCASAKWPPARTGTIPAHPSSQHSSRPSLESGLQAAPLSTAGSDGNIKKTTGLKCLPDIPKLHFRIQICQNTSHYRQECGSSSQPHDQYYEQLTASTRRWLGRADDEHGQSGRHPVRSTVPKSENRMVERFVRPVMGSGLQSHAAETSSIAAVGRPAAPSPRTGLAAIHRVL